MQSWCQLCYFFAAAVTDAAADIDDIAAALEDAIFKEFRSTETKYKNRVRSRIANLKVKRWFHLWVGIICGFTVASHRLFKLPP